MESIPFFKNNPILRATPLLKGWSHDQKYLVEDTTGKTYLVRFSAPDTFIKKQQQYDFLSMLATYDIPCSRPSEIGTLADGKVYLILSYEEGQDALDIIDTLSRKEAYLLGVEAGALLHKLHQIPIPPQPRSWSERYAEKMQKKIDTIMACSYPFPMKEELVRYYQTNHSLMKHRPQTFVHGDYHLGNMIVHQNHIKLIDFDKAGVADPYDDLKPYCWNAMRSEPFQTGIINGYFDSQIPPDFFPILKFYTVESLLSHLPWAISYGPQEVETAYRVIEYQMKWWDSFRLYVPTWYQGTAIDSLV